jgi:hypothetical protein
MRFLVQPAAAPRARAPVRIFLVFAALALAGFAVQRLLAGGLSAAEVEAYYLGAAGGDPLPAAALWEEVHANAFLYGFVLFMLGALLAVCAPRRTCAALLGAAFVATLADLLAPFVIAAVHGAGALRVATFVAATGTLAALFVVVAARFARGGGDARA